jgi:translocation and assembly module TamB
MIRHIKTWSLRVTLALLVVVALLVAGLATTPGQRAALGVGSWMASSGNAQVEIGRLEGSLFGEGRIERISLSDKHGVWLDVRNVRYGWSPLALLRGRLVVDDFHVTSIEIARKPALPKQPRETADGKPPSLIPIVLKQARVDNLTLGEALAGTRARFRIEASLQLVDLEQGLSAKLAAVRLDEKGTRVNVDFSFAGKPRRLSLDVSAAEPPNGLVGQLIGLTDAPSLALKLRGDGPLDGWHANWSTTASGKPFIVGRIRVDRDGARYRLASDFTGYVQTIVPGSIKDLFAGKTTGSLIAFVSGQEGFDVPHIQLMSEALDLRGTAGYTAETSHYHGWISSKIARKDGRPVHFAMANGDRLSLGRMDLKLEIPNTRSAREISLAVAAADVRHPSGAAAEIDLTAQATQAAPTGASAFDAERINVKLATRGVNGREEGLSDAIGRLAQAELSGSLKAGVLTLDQVRAGDEKTFLIGNGRLSKGEQKGTAKLIVGDLGALSALVGKPIRGQAEVAVEADADVAAGRFSAKLDGKSGGLSLGEGVVASLIGPGITFSGEVVRERNGSLKVRKLDVAGANLSLTASGRYSNNVIELDHVVDIPKLSHVQLELRGGARLEGQLQGTPRNLVSKIRLITRDAAWRGHTVRDLRLAFDGEGPIAAHVGRLDLTGQIGALRLTSGAQLTVGSAGTLAARGFELAFGEITAAGDLSLAPGAIPTGALTLDARKLADLSFLIGQPVSGGLTAKIDLREHRNASRAVFDIAAPSLKVGRNAITGARVFGDLKSYFTGLNGQASLDVSRLSVEGVKVKNLSVRLRDADGRMAATGSTTVNGGRLDVSGSFSQQGAALDIVLDDFEWRDGALSVRLRDRARMKVEDREVRIAKLRLSAASGQIEVEGVAGPERVALDVAVDQLPAEVANAFVPSLGASGLISAEATVRGKPAAPVAKVRAKWANASVQALRENSLPPVTAVLDGSLSDGFASAKLDVRGAHALSLSIVGDAAIESAPERLNFRIGGDIPLSLANPALAARATRLSGRATLSGTLKGTIDAPRLVAQLSVAHATVDDPTSGIKLTRLVGLIDISERDVRIRKFTGESALGGTMSLGGRLLIAGDPSMAVELTLAGLKFNDRKLLAGEVDGQVKVAGPLEALSVGGRITLKRVDVTVPAAVPRSIATLNVKHVNAPERLKAPIPPDNRQAKAAHPAPIALNLRIDAANRIFVKGRGVDAKLGGDLRVLGSSNTPLANGAFQMVRGRLDILGRRLEFRHGRIVFNGGLEPLLDMEAAATVDDVTILVTITGAASSPVFKFSSEPELPEEEVIARLLFNKALVGLSPLQLVQLASEVDKIGGLSSGPGILDALKQSVGVDVLDISTDKEGKATVSAGSYVTDKTFVGVRQGTNTTSSRVVIDHDLTKNLKARGEVGADGNSKLGVGFEWNY